jgi:phosphoribosylformylglycinamidine cyclo-ligase
VARVLPHGLQAKITAGSWPEPAVFSFLRSEGRIAEEDMRQTFNLGLGMVLVVGMESAGRAIARLEADGIRAFEVGRVEKGNRGAVIE